MAERPLLVRKQPHEADRLEPVFWFWATCALSSPVGYRAPTSSDDGACHPAKSGLSSLQCSGLENPGERGQRSAPPHRLRRKIAFPARALSVPLAPWVHTQSSRLHKAHPQRTGAGPFNKQNPTGFYYFGQNKMRSYISKSSLTALSTQGVLFENM